MAIDDSEVIDWSINRRSMDKPILTMSVLMSYSNCPHIFKRVCSVDKQHYQPSLKCKINLNTTQSPFFENLLNFDIARENRSAVFEATIYFAFSLP